MIFSRKNTYNLFNINQYNIKTSKFSHILHDEQESVLEEEFSEYVGAKYACVANSASSLLTLCMLAVKEFGAALQNNPISIPSMIPLVVPNILYNLDLPWKWKDDVDWIGSSYVLYDSKKIYESTEGASVENSFKIIDSAQEVRRDQFKDDASSKDLMVFSFYPTKPVGGMDGGIIVSNDKDRIDWFRAATHLGVVSSRESSWDRKLDFPGWKMHPNSSQCYVAINNLRKLDKKNKILDGIKDKYNSEFGINNTSRHLYRIDVDDRDRFIKKMKRSGIATGIHYSAAHNETAYSEKASVESPLKNTDTKSKTTVSIPFNEKLKEKDTDFIIKKIRENT